MAYAGKALEHDRFPETYHFVSGEPPRRGSGGEDGRWMGAGAIRPMTDDARPLLAFYGGDFTGSTDAPEALALLDARPLRRVAVAGARLRATSSGCRGSRRDPGGG